MSSTVRIWVVLVIVLGLGIMVRTRGYVDS